MIDATNQPLMTMAETAASLPTSRRREAITIARWCLRGIRGVRLDSIKVGGQRYTTQSAVQEFLKRTNEERP